MPTELTAAARRELRRLGRALRPAVQVGKEGLSAGAIAKVNEQLDQHELVKVKALESAPEPPAHLAERLESETGAAVAGAIGRTVVLYRPNPQLAPAKRVRLP